MKRQVGGIVWEEDRLGRGTWRHEDRVGAIYTAHKVLYRGTVARWDLWHEGRVICSLPTLDALGQWLAAGGM